MSLGTAKWNLKNLSIKSALHSFVDMYFQVFQQISSILLKAFKPTISHYIDATWLHLNEGISHTAVVVASHKMVIR